MVAEAPMAGASLTAGLRRKSNRVARVLAYALLEWILIVLLLANGVFSYLISRFAAFFGLAPPCALCSRLGVDSLFESHRQGVAGAGAELLRRVLCDAHAAEFSRLGYCSAHRRLADAGDMCEDCAAAAAPRKALLSWMGRSELGERDLSCACCGVALESGFYSPPFLLPRVASRDLDCGQKEECTASLNEDVVFVSEEGPAIELFDEKPLLEDDSLGVMAQCVERQTLTESIDLLGDTVAAISSQPGDEMKEMDDHGAVRRDEMFQDTTTNGTEEKSVMISDDDKMDGVVDELIDEQICTTLLVQACIEGLFDDGINAAETVEGFAHQQSPEDDSGLKDKDLKTFIGDQIYEDEHVKPSAVEQELCTMPRDPKCHEHLEKLGSSDEVEHYQQVELQHKLDSMLMVAAVPVSATSFENTKEEKVQLADLNQVEGQINALAVLEQECDSVQIDSGKHFYITSYTHTDDEEAGVKEKSSSTTADILDYVGYVADTFDGSNKTVKEDIEGGLTESAQPSLEEIPYQSLIILDKICPDHRFVEERTPDTPTHIGGLCDPRELLDSKAVLSDAKSVGSSVATMSSDLEITDDLSVDQLRSALAAARKSLSILCAELENERNAAAISADETMAMINRLQEQKAAMQMEAIQYQRLMEEQSEYDQEALQKLNEVVLKREKEKQDLERELELYRHKVHLYETKARKMSRNKVDDQNGSSSASSSAEDSDDLSQSFYEGDESGHGLNGSNGSIPTDVLQETARHLVILDVSLADFEEERLSILERLKVLEDQLFDLDDGKSDDTKADKYLSEENHLSSGPNGFSDDDSCFKLHDGRKSVSYRGKKLLPLFDNATVETGKVHLTKQSDEADHSKEVTLELAREEGKHVIANEIDEIHERLHALEADKEFIKLSVRSLKKGGKGFDLLQEISQHLRDLRRIEQRAKNSGELSPHYLHPFTD